MVLLLTLGKNIAQKKLKMYFPEIALTQVNQHHDLSHQALSGRGYCQKYLSFIYYDYTPFLCVYEFMMT